MRFEVQVANPVDKKAVPSEDGERELVDQSPSGAEMRMPPSEDARSRVAGGRPVRWPERWGIGETPYYRCVVFLEAKGAR